MTSHHKESVLCRAQVLREEPLTLRGTCATPGTSAQLGNSGFLKIRVMAPVMHMGKRPSPGKERPGAGMGSDPTAAEFSGDVLPQGAPTWSDKAAGAPFPGQT